MACTAHIGGEIHHKKYRSRGGVFYADKNKDPKAAAIKLADERKHDPKNIKKRRYEAGPIAFKHEFIIEHRPGEQIRCARYCDVSRFCVQWQALKPKEKEGAAA